MSDQTNGGEKTKRVPQSHINVDVKDLSTAQKYLKQFNALPLKPKSGFDNYYGVKDGFTNPLSPTRVKAQGVAKMLLVLNQQAAAIMAAGGDEAQSMATALGAIREFQDTAVAEAETSQKNARIEQAVKTLMDTGMKEGPARKVIEEQLGSMVKVKAPKAKAKPAAKKSAAKKAKAKVAADSKGNQPAGEPAGTPVIAEAPQTA